MFGTFIAFFYTMIQVNKSDSIIAFDISSEIPMVSRLIDEVGGFIGGIQVTRRIALILFLKAFLIDTIDHGKNGKHERIIRGRLELLKDSRLIIEVESDLPKFRLIW